MVYLVLSYCSVVGLEGFGVVRFQGCIYKCAGF